ncbi:hypothetical protein [Phenylobacterium sp.]|uniref:hypothetical protein n=1 Tax=Phenylobacterium sp. TaxID=1871053 RepID=UPI002DE7A2C9|nr:hypothetical protein [Phenylobacterium sp.]
MSVAREPYTEWAPVPWRPGLGAAATALYWLAAALFAARAYDLGFHRYEPNGSLFSGAGDKFALLVARDAGLWAATATAAAALALFLVILAFREAAARLGRRIGPDR